MNVFEALREDHEKQRTPFDLVTKTEGDSDGREELFARLKTSLETHAEAEERWFYRKLMEHDLTMEKARHSIAEHKEIDDLIELEGTDHSSPGWLPKAKQLAELVTHHLAEEENEVFQMAGKSLSDPRRKHSRVSIVRKWND